MNKEDEKMLEDIKLDSAKQVYKFMCESLESRGLEFGKEEDELIVHFGVLCDNKPMQIILTVDIERQLIRLMSPMPFKIGESKRIEGAIATCAASFGMVDGSFDYDISNGSIVFRMTSSFMDSSIGKGLFDYMINCSCAMVDNYYTMFLELDKGLIGVDKFINY